VSNIITAASKSVYAATSSSSSSGATSGTTANPAPGGKMDKNAFLKLLTTQMRYQDPLDPMDGKQMAADLAQFSGLEQLLNINEKLDAQAGQFSGLAQAMSNASAMGTIGKTVMIESDKVLVTKDAKGNLGGSVLADITTSGVAKLTLLDKSGREVGSRSLGYIGTGTQQTFDLGTALNGVAAEGAYQVRINVAGTDGKDVPQKTYTVGKVDGLMYGPDGAAMLTMGPLQIAYSAIVKILA